MGKTYKKILNFAPVTEGAGAIVHKLLVNGVDSISPGQLGVTDATVPTGAIITHIEIQFVVTNLVSVFAALNIAIQYTLQSQSPIDPRVIGGNQQRNQVFFQSMRAIAKDQNQTLIIRFKIPKSFQRVKEGMQWHFSHVTGPASSDAAQVIYKMIN